MSEQATQINQPGLVLTPGPEGWWDSERVSAPQVMHCADGTWKMWYYGRDASFDRQINLPTGRCGLAISADGIHWERVHGPLTMGSVFEPSPDPNRFDSAHVGVSDVNFFDGLYWMWFRLFPCPKGFWPLGCASRGHALCSADGGWEFPYVLYRC